ncbi:MAG: hypothetical protein PVH88_11070 [Ignavibacteria bacterium]|jgi:hypothetical protein
MKNLLSIVFIAVFVFSCSTREEKGPREFKEITKIETKALLKINDSSENQFYYPKIIYDGSKIFFTTKDYNEIWYYDFTTKLIINVTPVNGVGKEFVFSKDSKKIYYVLPSVTVRTKEKIYTLLEYDIDNKSRNVIYTNSDGVSNMDLLDGDIISFWVNESILFYDLINKHLIQDFTYEKYLINSIGSKLLIYHAKSIEEKKVYNNEDVKDIKTSGNGYEYYLTTVDNNIIKYNTLNENFEVIGNFKNFNTSQNSNLLYYSNNSKFFLKASSQNKFIVLNVDGVNSILNPSVSFSNDSFVFNNEKGEIYFLEVKIEEKLPD